MQRIQDTFLETIQSQIPLTKKVVFEVGCGDGSRTSQIARICQEIIAIDPDQAKIDHAKLNNPLHNGFYTVACADALPQEDHTVDVVIFTLSLHNVSSSGMNLAIDEAIRIVREDGYIIFFEPTFCGSFFEAEIAFDACDGDERAQKALAYSVMLSHEGLEEVVETFDETIFRFDSVQDFILSMDPKNIKFEEILAFLEKHQYLLNAERRINIYRPR